MEQPSSTGDFACTSATLAGDTHDDELPSERRDDRLFCRAVDGPKGANHFGGPKGANHFLRDF